MSGGVILAESALSFLGVGVPLTTTSWGGMIAEGRCLLVIAWWILVFPGLAITVVCLLGNTLGDGIQAALDRRP